MEVSGSPDEPYEVVLLGHSDEATGASWDRGRCEGTQLIYLNTGNPSSAILDML